MSSHPLAKYLAECRQTKATGRATPETAYYPALQKLLESAGAGLKPRVFAVMGLSNQGAGMPDGGLFTPDQLAGDDGKVRPGQMAGPSRGVVECKPPADEVAEVADTDQVSRYWKKYDQVLVTNYRDFRLIGTDAHGIGGQTLETFRLAETEAGFWALAADPAAAAGRSGDRLMDFLSRCMRRPVPLSDPKDVAWYLASYARDARGRLDKAADLGKLGGLQEALQDALGLHVEDAAGEQFFRSALVQTLFYGLFAAWVLWHRRGETEAFDWEKADKYLHVPVLRKLFRELTSFPDLFDLDLTEPMGWAEGALNRVDRGKFFARFEDGGAVQYFYEPFLEAFDPEVRKSLGVWYTPPEVVRYMVSRVDRVLRERFGRPDGLADPGVFVLDPCCGTGTFLVEVLAAIARTLAAKGEGAMAAADLRRAATDRVFGFEILPAPFVVAHLQVGLFLQAHGATLSEKKRERAGVYLTNALTGWGGPGEKARPRIFQEFEEERDQADRVKRKVPLLVVLGNPPYNGFAGLPADEDAGLVEPYRTASSAGQGLNDLYVRFLRVAERAISEGAKGHGLVCYVSNYSWLDGRSHAGLRERLLREFSEVWVDSLNGDKRKTGKRTPDGRPDPSVFSTPANREGIQVGAAVTLLVRSPGHAGGPAEVRFKDFWGDKKREELEAHGKAFDAAAYQTVRPSEAMRFAFRPAVSGASYPNWPSLVDLFPAYFTGVKTSRDEGLVSIDRDALESRIRAYFDAAVTHEAMGQLSPKLMTTAARFEPISTRETLQRRGILADNFVRFLYRPFDTRWLYWEPSTKLLDEKRTDYFPHVHDGNLWLAACQANRKDFDPPIVCRPLATIHIIERTANLFPLHLRPQSSPTLDFATPDADPRRVGNNVANLSAVALGYLFRFGLTAADAGLLFHHAVAVLHAPKYATDHADALRQDWPRVPLPATRDELEASAALGVRVAALLDSDAAAEGGTSGVVGAGFQCVAGPSKAGGGNFGDDDFEVTARWGHAGQGGATMPGPGKSAARPFTDAEAAALGADAVARLGPDTLDVYLNPTAFWRNVPRAVWNYKLGGYQVLKKWLSYRERKLLGRALTSDEVRHFRATARRIAALILLGPELDRNYTTAAADAAALPPAASAALALEGAPVPAAADVDRT